MKEHHDIAWNDIKVLGVSRVSQIIWRDAVLYVHGLILLTKIAISDYD